MKNYRLSTDPTRPADFTCGALFIYNPEAPSPADLLPNPEKIRTALAVKIEAREKKISEILASTPDGERWIAAMQHDMEFAPRSTNAKQLEELGIFVPTAEALSVTHDGAFIVVDEAVKFHLWAIIYGLASLGIFLTDTNHLDDRALLISLVSRILQDEIPDIAPSRDMSEYISLNVMSDGEPCSNRDSLLPQPDRDFLDMVACN